jgi:hypothetical protein
VEVHKRRANFLTSSSFNEGFLCGNGPSLFTKDKARLEPFIDGDQFWVSEKLFINGIVTEEYTHGPFLTSDEASSYAEQRHRWYMEEVVPLFGSNQVAEPFEFIFPPP